MNSSMMIPHKHLRMSSVEQNIQLWTCTLFLCILKNVFKCLFYHKGYIYNLCRGKWCSWVKWHNQNFYMEMKKTSKQSQGKETDQLYLLLHCKCQSQVGALQLWQRHVQQEGREDIIRYLQEYSGRGREAQDDWQLRPGTGRELEHFEISRKIRDPNKAYLFIQNVFLILWNVE